MPPDRSPIPAAIPRGAAVDPPSVVDDCFVCCDNRWRVISVNDAARQLCGGAREELIGQEIWTIFPSGLGEAIAALAYRAASEKVSLSQELFFEPRGSWYDVRAHPEEASFCVSLRNITSRKTREGVSHADRELLALMFESATDYAIFSLDEQRRVTSWNAGAERLFGFSADEILGQLSDIIYTPEDRVINVPEEEIRKAAEQGRAEDTRWHLRKDGSRFFAAGMVRPMYDEAGTLRGYAKIAQDMTENRRNASALQQQANLLDLSHDAIMVWRLDGPISYWNRGAEQLYGFTAEEALGRTPHELLQTKRFCDDQSLPSSLKSEGQWTGELCHTCQDGRKVLVESRQVLIHPQNSEPLVLETNRDMTERDKAEEALREREAQLQLAIEIAQMGTFNIDLLTDEVVVNEIGREIYGFRPGEPLTFTKVQAHFHPEDAEEVMRRVEAALDPNQSNRFEVDQRIIRTDDAIRWIRVFGRVFFAGEGDARRPVRCIGTYTDTTPLKEAEALLQEANRRKDEFLAMLAHELRNPLAAIRNALHVSDSPDRDTESFEWSRGVIDRQSAQLARLVDDLLDVSRITSGKIRLRKEVLDAAPLLDHAAEAARPLISARGHELITGYGRTGALLVEADAARLEQVVVNLLTNAAKYMETGGKIWLNAWRQNSEVIISVRDTGVGIPPEKLPQMFEPFAQGERSIARSEGGLGLGLTIVRTLVEMHGGTVIAESEGVGKGSEFTVRLDAATGESVAHVPEPSTEASQDSTCQARILVVDDNADTAHGLARLLTRRGYAVKIAFDGRAGLETARQYRPQIVLLDIGLPGMDGFEVAAELRRESCCEDALLIAISGYGQAEDLRQSRAAGFDHHLIKPVDLGQLHQLLEQWCERSIRGKGR